MVRILQLCISFYRYEWIQIAIEICSTVRWSADWSVWRLAIRSLSWIVLSWSNIFVITSFQSRRLWLLIAAFTLWYRRRRLLKADLGSLSTTLYSRDFFRSDVRQWTRSGICIQILQFLQQHERSMIGRAVLVCSKKFLDYSPCLVIPPLQTVSQSYCAVSLLYLWTRSASSSLDFTFVIHCYHRFYLDWNFYGVDVTATVTLKLLLADIA